MNVYVKNLPFILVIIIFVIVITVVIYLAKNSILGCAIIKPVENFKNVKEKMENVKCEKCMRQNINPPIQFVNGDKYISEEYDIDSSYQPSTQNPNYENLPKINSLTYNQIKTLDSDINSSSIPEYTSDLPKYEPEAMDPSVVHWLHNLPVVEMKNRQALLADPFRGDVPITFYPELSVIGGSRFDRDSLKLDGFFSEGGSARIEKLGNMKVRTGY